VRNRDLSAACNALSPSRRHGSARAYAKEQARPEALSPFLGGDPENKQTAYSLASPTSWGEARTAPR